MGLSLMLWPSISTYSLPWTKVFLNNNVSITALWPWLSCEEEIELVELRRKAGEVEARSIGSLGKDDLFVKLAGLEFQFCQECDVQIHFTEPSNDDVEAFFARWQKLGYEPSEWVATQERGPGERVR